jgi:hypothetical protein
MELLNRDKTGLAIFDNFQVDRTLPKYKSGVVGESKNPEPPSFIVSGGQRAGAWGDRDMSDANGIDSGFIMEMGTKTPKQSRWDKFVYGLKKKEKVPVYTYTVEEFFKSIKNSSEELIKIDERIDSFNVVLKHAKEFNQKALVEKLEDELLVLKSETQLYAINLTTIITEEQIIKFAKEAERHIHLDWIANFVRIIPSKILDIKKKADALKIFDNYVVLHYDPTKKNTALTKKEKDDMGDPILFGVIEHSHKLYYVGDWIDEYCDLTLQKFIDKFGTLAIDQNNITANIQKPNN